MAINDKAIQELIGAIAPDTQQKKSSTYAATVSRIDGEGTVWVNIAGSEKETPTATTSAEVKPGDAVTVEWRNNKLYIAGNLSNPSAGVARVATVEQAASQANQNALQAQDDASDAMDRANDSYTIAANTDQYFWTTETGTDTGAHITEYPKDEWNDSEGAHYHSGGNLLARSNGIAVRDGLTELATFDSDGAEIYSDGNKIAKFGYIIDPYTQTPKATISLGDESIPHLVIQDFAENPYDYISSIGVKDSSEIYEYFSATCATETDSQDPSLYNNEVVISDGSNAITMHKDSDNTGYIRMDADDYNIYSKHEVWIRGDLKLSSGEYSSNTLDVGYKAYFGDHIYLTHGKAVFIPDANGNYQNVFDPWNSSNNTSLGYGHYSNSIGNLNLYGNGINLTSNGNINANQPLKVGGYKIITTQTFNADNISITANGYAEGSISITKTGYTPIGVLDTYVNNASSSGSGSSFAAIYKTYHSGNTYYYGLRNVTNSAIKVRVYAKILYVATSQGI